MMGGMDQQPTGLSNKAIDARYAMVGLLIARSLSVREEEESFPEVIAELAWRIAEAMNRERTTPPSSRPSAGKLPAARGK